MPQKTREEIYEYVLNYKNKALGQYNDGAESLYHRANDIDVKLGSDLIVLASAGIALIGGIVASQPDIGSGILRLLLAFAVLMLFVSIGGGLKYYSDVQKFWKTWGDLKHEQAGMLYKDESKTVEELEVLLDELKKKGEKAPKRSDVRARKIQVFAFVIGVGALCLVIFGILVNTSPSSNFSHNEHHSKHYHRF